MSKYTLGAVLSPPDHRDYAVKAFLPAKAVTLPAKWDFSQVIPPVRDQGQEGTCVGQATATVCGYWQIVAPTPTGAPPDREVLSARDAYEGARTYQMPPGDGEGAYPRQALRWAQQQGLCRDDFWPYVAHNKGAAKPGAEASRAQNRIQTYSRVGTATIAEVREALYYHGPALMAMTVDEGFMRTGADGAVVTAGQAVGGHAMAIIGWDDSLRAFHVRNSWGTGWGDKGDCWLPYSVAIPEAWVCTPNKGEPAPELNWLERLFPWLF